MPDVLPVLLSRSSVTVAIGWHCQKRLQGEHGIDQFLSYLFQFLIGFLLFGDLTALLSDHEITSAEAEL